MARVLVRAGAASWSWAGTRVDALARRGASSLISTAARHHGPDGVLAREWPTGASTLWVVVLLGICLLIYYL